MHVAVIGAGPAGAWTAYELARRGVRVTVFDGSHPREKPCGGGVTGRAIAIVSDALKHVRFTANPIERARFTHNDGATIATVDLDPQMLVVASRREFDEALLDAAVSAGATFCPVRVLDVRVEGGTGGVAIRTGSGCERADVLVGADGANSLVRRRVSHRLPRQQLSIATGFFARGVTSREIVLETEASPPGYIWSFPRPDHLAIGICAQADGCTQSRQLIDRAARWIERSRIAPASTLRPYSWPIPTLDAQTLATQSVAGRGWCLVGDAAGLVDPITREGIYFALQSATYAAEAIATKGPAAACLYSSRLQEHILPELTKAAQLKAGFFRAAFTDLMLHALRDSARIRRVMAELIAGVQPYRSLGRRLARTLEIGLAWQALKMRRDARARS